MTTSRVGRATRNPLKVLILSGTLEMGMRPVPPVADGAPEWNIYRLAEAAFTDTARRLEIHIISPCEEAQCAALQDFPARAVGRYQHVVFSTRWLDVYRKVLRRFWLLSRLFKLPDLLSWVYLRRALPRIKELAPDVIIINDRPQYIHYLKHRLGQLPLWLMVRYPMGESRRFLGLLDGIIVNSAGMKKYVEGFAQPGTPPIYPMPNTLGDEFVMLSVPADRFTSDKKTVLFVGRLIEEKGARELLLAFQQVYACLPAARLVICGVGTGVYEQNLHALAAQLPPGVVTFAGYIPYQQLAEYYCRATVAVFPSLPGVYIESFGMVALEAMRCATPVVAARQPGFEELIEPGQSGLLVDDPRDATALAGAILQILQDPDLAQHIGQIACLRSLAYNPQGGLRRLEKIFGRLDRDG